MNTHWSVAFGPSPADDSTTGKFFLSVCLKLASLHLLSWPGSALWLTGLVAVHDALTSPTMGFFPRLDFSRSCGWNVTLGPLATWAVWSKALNILRTGRFREQDPGLSISHEL